MKRVRRIVATREVDGGYFKFRSNEGNVTERALRGFEAFAGDIFLEVRIGATVINSVARALAVKLDDEFEIIKVVGQLVLLMSEAEFFSTEPAYFFLARKE